MPATYLVTVDGGGLDSRTGMEIRGVLTSKLPYNLYVTSVKKYDPENQKDHGKISAIKRIRALLSCSLMDAKFLTDVAQFDDREAHWDNVHVTYDLLTDKFRVIDNRP